MAENEVFYRIRRENLIRLIQTQAEGNASAFARRHGINQSRLNRYVTTRVAPKPVGHIAARSLERDIGLEERDLDRLPDGTFPDVPMLISEAPPDAEMLVQSIADIRDAVPFMRRNLVAELVRQVIIQPESPIVSLLTEELERGIAEMTRE
jgi:hypothetical protein